MKVGDNISVYFDRRKYPKNFEYGLDFQHVRSSSPHTLNEEDLGTKLLSLTMTYDGQSQPVVERTIFVMSGRLISVHCE